jgi:2-keto-4-pentenoate hydratase
LDESRFFIHSGEGIMSDEERIQQGTRFLLEEHRERRPFAPIPTACAPRTVEEAYAMQDTFTTLVATRRPVAGYKIALTTPVMQQMLGFPEPIAGSIVQTIHHSPCTIRSADYVHLGVECEIAVQLGRTLRTTGAPWNRARVAEAIGTVMAAFEIVDDRNANYAQLATQIFSVIADNAWNAGIVLGPPVTDWRSLDLAAVRGTMRINGQIVGEGQGRDVMGHPLEALTWLANILAARGQSLAEGMVIITGSIVSTKFVHPGDTVQAVVEGLGEVHLNVV